MTWEKEYQELQNKYGQEKVETALKEWRDYMHETIIPELPKEVKKELLDTLDKPAIGIIANIVFFNELKNDPEREKAFFKDSTAPTDV